MPRKPSPENLFAFDRRTLETVTLAPGQAERTVWDQSTPGFGLRLRQGGARVWVIRPAPSSGKYGLLTIGPTTQLSLTQAREQARGQLAKAHLGEAPREAKAKARAVAANQFGVVAESYIDRMETRLEATGWRDLKRHLRVHFRELHDMDVAAVRRGDIARCLDAVALKAPVAANRARSRLATFFAWAIGQGMLDMNPVAGTNKATAERARSRVLPGPELLKVWRGCPQAADFDHIVRLLILTGQRRDEVGGMRWDEIDLDEHLWTLPPERTKNGRRHEVPLAPAACAILRAIPRRERSEFVFGRGTGSYSGFSKAKDRLDSRVPLPAWRLHDLRRSCSTGMNELGVAPHVVEAILNHVSGARAGVAGVYNWALYRAEKAEALTLWSRHVLALGLPSLKVVAADPPALRG